MRDEFDAIRTIVRRSVVDLTETAIVTGVFDSNTYVRLRNSMRHVQAIAPRGSGLKSGDEVIVARSSGPALERRWHVVGIGKEYDAGAQGDSPDIDSHALSGAAHTGTLANAQGPQFPLLDGSRSLTANWDVGAFQVRASTLYADVAHGTAPLTVASKTLVSNLNADLLDNLEASALAQKAENESITGTWDFPATGFTIGTDVLLQRSAANVLATPDTLQVPTITAITNLTLQPAGNIELDPTGDDVLPGSVYTVNIGALTNKFLTLHAAELWVDTLVAHETRASIGGRILVGPATTMLAEDIDDSQINIPVEHNLFLRNHVLHLEGAGSVEFMLVSGITIAAIQSGAPGVGYFRVGSDVTAYFAAGTKFTVTGAAPLWNGEWTARTISYSAPNTTIYVDETIPLDMGAAGYILHTGNAAPFVFFVTRGHDTSPPNSWSAGSGVFSTGTTGDGWIDIYSVASMKGGTQAGPTIAGNVRTGTDWNQWVEHWAIGNLDGLYGISTDIYGIGLGKYGSDHILIDPTPTTGGIFFRDGSNNIRLELSTDGLYLNDSSGDVVITLPASGDATIDGTLAVTSPGEITAGSGAVTIDSDGISIVGTDSAPNKIKFTDPTSSLPLLEIYGYYVTGVPQATIKAYGPTVSVPDATLQLGVLQFGSSAEYTTALVLSSSTASCIFYGDLFDVRSDLYAENVRIKPNTGDPFILFDTISTGQDWAIGVDDSDSDRFKISKGTVLGTDDYFEIDTSGNWYKRDQGPGYIFVPFTTPLTTTKFNNSQYSTRAPSSSYYVAYNDWSTSIPTAAKALLIQIVVYDTGTAPAENYLSVGPSTSYWYALDARSRGGSEALSAQGVVPTGANAIIYYSTKASGINTLYTWMRCWGYFI